MNSIRSCFEVTLLMEHQKLTSISWSGLLSLLPLSSNSFGPYFCIYMQLIYWSNVSSVFYLNRYANKGGYEKAIEDFETALKYNPTHFNAKKYLAETLVALGRQ